MKNSKYTPVKTYLVKHADSLQKLATKMHKEFLGGKKFRSEIIEKYQANHRNLILLISEHIEEEDLKIGSAAFRKLADTIASDAVDDLLAIEEAVDGIIFLKQAIWQQLKKAGILNTLTIDEFYLLSQRIGTYVDIVSSTLAFTYHKKEEELKNNFTAIVQSSDDAIIGKSIDGKITSWNNGAQRLYGYTPDEIIGKPVSVLMPPSQKNDFPKIMKMLQKGKRVEHYETKRVTKDGEIRDVSITVSPIRDIYGKIIGASKIARDITERKRIDQQKDDFVGIATHELKTPVTSIKAYAQVLEKIFRKQKDERSAEYLGKMDAQLNKLTSLIADLLDVTKIQSGQLPFHIEKFEFNTLVEEIGEELQRTTEKHSIEFNLSKSIAILGDRDRIGQVLTNLISNAIKYSPHSKKIIISTVVGKKMITLSVQDFGVGIPKEKQEKVFEKFFRVSGPKQDTLPGMGLGLYISSEIIKRQKGRIWVESSAGKGSTFYFTLPINQKIKTEVSSVPKDILSHE